MKRKLKAVKIKTIETEKSFDDLNIYALRLEICRRKLVVHECNTAVFNEQQKIKKLENEISALTEMCKIMEEKQLFKWGDVYDS